MLLNNIFILVLLHIARLVVPLLVIPILTRTITEDAFGIYMYTLAFSIWLAIFIEYGFNISSTRDIASSKDFEKIQDVVSGTESAKIILALASIPIALIALLFFPPFSGNWNWAFTSWCLGILTAFSPVYYFQGREKLRIVGFTEIVGSGIMLAGIFTFIKNENDFYKLPAIIVIPRLLSTCILIRRMHKEVKSGTKNWLSPVKGVFYLRHGFNFFKFQAAVSLYTSFNVIFLGFICTPAEVGAYATAEKLMRAGLGFISQASFAIFPRLNELKVKDTINFDKLRLYTLIGIFVAGMIGMLIAWGVTPYVVKYFLGGNISQVSDLLNILASLIPAIALSNVLGYHFLIVDHREKAFNRIIMFAAGLNLVTAYFMVINYGVQGMAYTWVVIEWLITASIALVVFNFRSSSKK